MFKRVSQIEGLKSSSWKRNGKPIWKVQGRNGIEMRHCTNEKWWRLERISKGLVILVLGKRELWIFEFKWLRRLGGNLSTTLGYMYVGNR